MHNFSSLQSQFKILCLYVGMKVEYVEIALN